MANDLKTLGRYEIREELGRGGFGTVYRAWDPALEIEVALKVLDPHLASRDPALVQGFLREARIAARLNHEGIVRIYDVGEAEGTFYIAMHYLPGASLADVIRREAPMSVARAVELLQPVAKALDHAHARDLIHRDVKPANVIFDAEGRPVLVDFGLVKAAEGTSYVSLSGRVAGTVQYAAPEQLSALRVAEVGPTTDVYALGIVAYQMLSGQVPFDGDTAAVIGSQLHDLPPPLRTLNPDIREEVEIVLLQALAKEPEERFQSAEAFVATLVKVATPEVREQLSELERERRHVEEHAPQEKEPAARISQTMPERARISLAGFRTALVCSVILVLSCALLRIAYTYTPLRCYLPGDVGTVEGPSWYYSHQIRLTLHCVRYQLDGSMRLEVSVLNLESREWTWNPTLGVRQSIFVRDDLDNRYRLRVAGGIFAPHSLELAPGKLESGWLIFDRPGSEAQTLYLYVPNMPYLQFGIP